MKTDAQIVSRKTPYGDTAEWLGAKNAASRVLANHLSDGKINVGDVYDVGRLKVRVVAFPLLTADLGVPMDVAAVMLESPHAQLYWLYREKAEALIRVFGNVEARIWSAYCGFMLRPSPEGERLRVTGFLADCVL